MKNINRQIRRFVLVGLISNLILYLAYLGMTGLGVKSKIAMTMLFVVGTLQTFIVNRKWTFDYRGYTDLIFLKYAVSSCLGYVVNLAGLLIFVDCLGYRHQLVQGIMILVVAALLFSMQKFWVFRYHGQSVRGT